MFDDERTVTATLLSGATLRRAGMFCTFEISDEAVDLDDAAGIPLLNNHEERLGVVDEAWIEDGELRATLCFDETPIGQAAFQVVQRGEISGISIGNSILEWREIGPDNYFVTDWELREVSLCEEPLDPGAHVHGYGIRDICERMRVRQHIIEASIADADDDSDDDDDADDDDDRMMTVQTFVQYKHEKALARSVRRDDYRDRLVFYGEPRRL
jgi:HK97 family phage prohead protease